MNNFEVLLFAKFLMATRYYYCCLLGIPLDGVEDLEHIKKWMKVIETIMKERVKK